MINPKNRNEKSDREMLIASQVGKSDLPSTNRILQLLGGREAKWLAKETGLSASTISDAINGRTPRVDRAIRISKALEADVEHVFGEQAEPRLAARQSGLLVNAADADWIEIPEYALHEIDELGKMSPISTALMRRDWLYTSLGDATGLWIARLPARYDALTIGTGTPLFCKDYRKGERLSEGSYYLFRINGGIVMAPFSFREAGAPDDAVHSRNIGQDDDQYHVVARVIGQLARPI